MKTCAKCGRNRPIDDFHKQKGGDGHRSRCRDCINEQIRPLRKAWWQKHRATALKQNKSWKTANPDRVKATWKSWYQKNRVRVINNWRKRKYGLSFEEYEKLITSQKGLCKVCCEAAQLVVDHCHKSGAVRGLLCGQCNSILGFVREDISILQGLIIYLERAQ